MSKIITRSIKFKVQKTPNLDLWIKTTLFVCRQIINFYLEIIEIEKENKIELKKNGKKASKKLIKWITNKKWGLTALEYLTVLPRVENSRHVKYPIVEKFKPYPPLFIRRACINYAIGLYRGYIFARSVFESISFFILFSKSKNMKLSWSSIPSIYRYSIIQKFSKFKKTGIIETPNFPKAPRILEIYNSKIQKIKKNSIYIDIPLLIKMKWEKKSILLNNFSYGKRYFSSNWEQKSPCISAQNGAIYVQGVFESKNEFKPKLKQPDHIVGVDLNYSMNIGVLSVITRKNKIKKILFLREFYRKKISQYNKRKKGYIINDICHKVSRKIVEIAKEYNAWIALEKLSFRNSFKKNGNYHDFPYGKIRDLVVEKAKEYGIKVGLINPRNTSSICWSCGKKITRDRKNHHIICNYCGKKINDDLNGSLVIAKLGWKFFNFKVD